ncbi:DUF6439 family protein [Dactylococcopsis salina]|uniref:Tetratricopeptide repeat protein n=1 Tax=Dactylococcopsis salina (strain PCC 8305) TaxID=13035 RepID=K9YWL5_DACS8|nr:DUF6439 family protein [Dactylococcopsis salina]AFZ50700.1 hypothetical protein Dacsa_2058 [Dactylococcopsis salina PCC 8305]
MSQSISTTQDDLAQKSTLELAQLLAEKCAIAPNDWHRLKANRKAQANQHITAALVYLESGQTQEALAHLQQAVGWLDRSVSPLPCPTHGTH